MPLSRRTLLLSTPALATPVLATFPSRARAAEPIRIGQATPALSFLPLWAARATDAFATETLALQWAAISGGDPACLAALESGDIDLAAVGSDTALAAIAKGQPFTLIYDLMGQMSLDLVVSTAFLQRTGVSPTDPLARRLAALKGALIGVSALGGTQDRVVRWVAAQGGVKGADLRVALVGAPPALEAALENGRIDGFMLSPPEAGVVAAGGFGARLIYPQQDFPQLAGIPTLVLVARQTEDPAARARITRAVAALSHASAATQADPAAMSERIGHAFFAKVPPAILRDAVIGMVPGLQGNGRFTAAQVALMQRFAAKSGNAAPTGDAFWTNAYFT
jgi:NitT/TauT family transport system substrate-binding protein